MWFMGSWEKGKNCRFQSSFSPQKLYFSTVTCFPGNSAHWHLTLLCCELFQAEVPLAGVISVYKKKMKNRSKGDPQANVFLLLLWSCISMTTLLAVLVTTLPSEIIQIVRVCSWSFLYPSCPDLKLCLMRVITLLASKFLLQVTWYNHCR